MLTKQEKANKIYRIDTAISLHSCMKGHFSEEPDDVEAIEESIDRLLAERFRLTESMERENDDLCTETY